MDVDKLPTAVSFEGSVVSWASCIPELPAVPVSIAFAFLLDSNGFTKL